MTATIIDITRRLPTKPPLQARHVPAWLVGVRRVAQARRRLLNLRRQAMAKGARKGWKRAH